MNNKTDMEAIIHTVLNDFKEKIMRMDRILIYEVLEETQGNYDLPKDASALMLEIVKRIEMKMKGGADEVTVT